MFLQYQNYHDCRFTQLTFSISGGWGWARNWAGTSGLGLSKGSGDKCFLLTHEELTEHMRILNSEKWTRPRTRQETAIANWATVTLCQLYHQRLVITKQTRKTTKPLEPMKTWTHTTILAYLNRKEMMKLLDLHEIVGVALRHSRLYSWLNWKGQNGQSW